MGDGKILPLMFLITVNIIQFLSVPLVLLTIESLNDFIKTKISCKYGVFIYSHNALVLIGLKVAEARRNSFIR